MKKSIVYRTGWGADGLNAGATDHYLEWLGDQRFTTPSIPFPCSLVGVTGGLTANAEGGPLTVKVRLAGRPFAELVFQPGDRFKHVAFDDELYPLEEGASVGLVCDVDSAWTASANVCAELVLAVYLCDTCNKPMKKDENGDRKCEDCDEE